MCTCCYISCHFYRSQQIRVKNKLKPFYKGEKKINKDLPQLHLHNANRWQSLWLHIKHKINQKLQSKIKITTGKQNENTVMCKNYEK